MRVGQWVELCQPGGRWLPFLVTHVYDANTVSGVAFSGQPAQVGWHRPVADFAHVTRGESNRQFREVAPVGATGGMNADAVKALVAGLIPASMSEEAVKAIVAAAVAEAEATDATPDAPPKQAGWRKGRK